MVIVESLVHFTVDEILAAVKHLVLPVLSGVNIQTVLTVLRNLKCRLCNKFSTFYPPCSTLISKIT